MGIAIVNPMSMSMHVSMKQFPLDVTGDIGPTKSIQISCIGTSGILKCLNSADVFAWFCNMHSLQFLQCLKTSLFIPGQ